MPTMYKGTPSKLADGTWGAKASAVWGVGRFGTGSQIRITTRSGESWIDEVTGYVSGGVGYAIVRLAGKKPASQDPKAAPKSTQKADPKSARNAGPRLATDKQRRYLDALCERSDGWHGDNGWLTAREVRAVLNGKLTMERASYYIDYIHNEG